MSEVPVAQVTLTFMLFFVPLVLLTVGVLWLRRRIDRPQTCNACILHGEKSGRRIREITLPVEGHAGVFALCERHYAQIDSLVPELTAYAEKRYHAFLARRAKENERWRS